MNRSAKIILERIMIFSAVTAFILSFMIVFETCVVTEIERTYLFSWFNYALTVISGLVFMIALEIFVNEKTKIGAHLRFILLYVIAIVVACYFFGTLDAPYLLIPVTIVHYFLESTVNDIFVFHDYFTEGYEGKTGKELIEYLFHNNIAALEFAQKRNSTRSTLFILGFIQFIILLIPNLLKYKVPVLAYVFALIFYFSLFIIFVMLGMFNNESYYAFLGFDKVVTDERKHYKIICGIFITGLLLALLFSSNHALINIPKISDKTYEIQKNLTLPDIPDTAEMPRIDMDGMLGLSVNKRGPGRLSGILKIVLKVVKIVGIFIAILLGVFFLIRPFFSDGWKNFIREKKLYYFLKQVWSDFKDLIKTIFFGKKDDSAYSTVGARTFSESIKDFVRGSKKSKAKKIELDRLTKQFMNVINWGAKRDVLYRKNLAPAEYTKLLALYFSEHLAQDYVKICESTGFLYEKALYDKELLTDSEEKEFNLNVNSILTFGNVK